MRLPELWLCRGEIVRELACPQAARYKCDLGCGHMTGCPTCDGPVRYTQLAPVGDALDEMVRDCMGLHSCDDCETCDSYKFCEGPKVLGSLRATGTA